MINSRWQMEVCRFTCFPLTKPSDAVAHKAKKKKLHHGQDVIIQRKVSGFQCLDQSSTAAVYTKRAVAEPAREGSTTATTCNQWKAS